MIWNLNPPRPAPADSKYIVQTADPDLTNEQSLGALTTGLLKNTVTGATGVLSTAVADTDFASAAVTSTYTPTVTFSTTNPTDPTYTLSPQGKYTTLGPSLVLFSAEFTYSSKGTGGVGNAMVSLPFTAAATYNIPCTMTASAIDWTANYTQAVGVILASASTVLLAQQGDNQNAAAITWAMLTNTSAVRLSGFFWR